jgi:hypothetical protein
VLVPVGLLFMVILQGLSLLSEATLDATISSLSIDETTVVESRDRWVAHAWGEAGYASVQAPPIASVTGEGWA